jgi:hypothetical protein
VEKENMPIPEYQLEAWCNPGAKVTSAQAYASIRAALMAANSSLTYPNPEMFLQGSYGSSTNVYADSDVDIVVVHNTSFRRDLSMLPAIQAQAYNGHFVDAIHGVTDHKAEVLRALQRYYGTANVKLGSKSIKVTVPNGRVVDVIPALEYRKYLRFAGPTDQNYITGISFDDASGNMIVNYPKQHIANGEAKNAANRTNGCYKQTVRMFKNARGCAVDRGLLKDDVAPSYFVECSLYNVPDSSFVANRQDSFSNVWRYLWEHIEPDSAVCQNEQIPLFGPSAQQWKVQDAFTFLQALQQLWNEWY